MIQLRAAIRKVLAAADRVDPVLASAVRVALARDDDYASLGKPPCDWDDPKAREALVDALVCDAQAALAVLDGHQLDGSLGQAGELLGLVAGQDVEAGEDGVFRIARRVARDRVISTVDVEARHGRKSRARTFDGYKSHFGVDPDTPWSQRRSGSERPTNGWRCSANSKYPLRRCVLPLPCSTIRI